VRERSRDRWASVARRLPSTSSRGGDRHHLAETRGARRHGLGKQVVRAGRRQPAPSKPLPDWNRIRAELRRRSVTLALLWQEYRETDGYGHGLRGEELAQTGHILPFCTEDYMTKCMGLRPRTMGISLLLTGHCPPAIRWQIPLGR
jgi:hypothetical protein